MRLDSRPGGTLKMRYTNEPIKVVRNTYVVGESTSMASHAPQQSVVPRVRGCHQGEQWDYPGLSPALQDTTTHPRCEGRSAYYHKVMSVGPLRKIFGNADTYKLAHRVPLSVKPCWGRNHRTYATKRRGMPGASYNRICWISPTHVSPAPAVRNSASEFCDEPARADA